ncbi:hypothetical protein F5890DRAFT_473589 [Lentinula detonsa]|uniref:Secreted protein n=1 Tax=Lentinula detonsa TaxID=2804962 RepID=A0AA38UWW0_9AGAR|nr:hypothetical protein F5890DRAFT_473589 [Lentinula detonsa]
MGCCTILLLWPLRGSTRHPFAGASAALYSLFYSSPSLLPMPVPLVHPQPDSRNSSNTDPFILYSRSVHDYTLRLWAESRKLAEEKARARAKDAALCDARRLELNTR